MRSTRALVRYCPDASFVIGRFVLTATTPAVMARWRLVKSGDELIAPHLLLAECTSVLTRYVYHKQVTEARARAVIAFMAQFPVRLLHAGALYTRAFEIARFAGWAKAYDALYLATAEHEDAELITLDRGMSDAARRLRIRATLVR